MADLHISHPRAKVARRWFFQDYFHFNLTFMNSTVFRNVNNDVAEAMNLSALEGLEERFSHQVKLQPVPPCILNQFFQAAINASEEMPLPPQRSRKLPSRRHQPQLRLSIHQVGWRWKKDASTISYCQELKSMRTPPLLPDSIMARFRPSPRTGLDCRLQWMC